MTIVRGFFSIALPVSVSLYLYFILAFASRLKRENPEYWMAIGSPSNTDPNGQVKVLSLVFVPGKLPAELHQAYWGALWRTRVFAALSLVSFIAVMCMIWTGGYK